MNSMLLSASGKGGGVGNKGRYKPVATQNYLQQKRWNWETVARLWLLGKVGGILSSSSFLYFFVLSDFELCKFVTYSKKYKYCFGKQKGKKERQKRTRRAGPSGCFVDSGV